MKNTLLISMLSLAGFYATAQESAQTAPNKRPVAGQRIVAAQPVLVTETPANLRKQITPGTKIVAEKPVLVTETPAYLLKPKTQYVGTHKQ